MAARDKLPQLQGRHMTCGGGFETWLQYVDGFTLRHFCAFELLNDRRGAACLADYQRRLVEAAVDRRTRWTRPAGENGFGVINEGLHYRASRDWGR
jgi:homocysteine S-methyltransferase